jgi:uncharacterized protein (TIGR02421 family)
MGFHAVADASVLSPRMQAADQAIVEVGKKIRVLNAIAWPAAMEERFLESWRAGKPRLPQPPLAPRPHPQEIAALDAVMEGLDRSHPIGNWLYKSAWSYRVAARMLEQIGGPGFTRCSTLLYGRPDFRYRSQEASNADAAGDMLRITDDLLGRQKLPVLACDIPAEDFAVRLRERMGEFFTKDKVRVVLDPELASKATAGSTKVTLRATALFSEADLEQLLEHEAFIHTATLLNGKRQPHLRALGVGAPRTTRTQEGLATFAEIVTGAMDIARLRRIALRVIMVGKALAGADFIEVFKGFLEAGQTEVESYRSAARVFRGGDVRGGECFTKDGAYLEGVFGIQLFIRRALQEGRGHLLPMLFVGRVTTGDVIALEPFLDSGLVARATYVPPWAREPHRVLALMAYSAGAQRFRSDSFELDRCVEFEDEVIAGAGADY